MKKLLLPLILFSACKLERNQNLAELRIKSDITAAKCASGRLSDGTYVTKCDLPRDDGKGVITVVAAQGGEFPFQTWAYKTTATLKDEAKTREEVNKAAQPAGAGSGSATTPTK